MARKGVHTELQLYLREINGIQLLTAQEEKDLGWLIVNDSCPEAKDRMIKSNLRLVIAISKNLPYRNVYKVAGNKSYCRCDHEHHLLDSELWLDIIQ